MEQVLDSLIVRHYVPWQVKCHDLRINISILGRVGDAKLDSFMTSVHALKYEDGSNYNNKLIILAAEDE